MEWQDVRYSNVLQRKKAKPILCAGHIIIPSALYVRHAGEFGMESNRHMKAALALTAVLCLLCILCDAAQATDTQPTSAPAVTPERIAALVKQLGDNSAAKREQATDELAKIGLPALPALHEASKSDDAEVVHRARLLRTAITKAAIANNEGLLWKTQLPDGFNRTLHLAGDMAVVHNDDDGNLHAYALADGTKKWEFQTGHFARLHVPPPRMVTIGTILITHVYDHGDDPETQPSSENPKKPQLRLAALDSATGDELWRHDAHSPISDGERLFCFNKNLHVCRLSPKDGSILWTLDAPKLIGTEPKDTALSYIQIKKDVCVFDIWYGKDDQSMKWRGTVIVEADIGKKLWDLETPDPDVYYVAERMVVNERLFLRLRKYADDLSSMEYLPVKMYDLKSGKELEMKEPDKKEWEHRNKLAMEGTTMIGDHIVWDKADKLEVYDLATGKRVWKHTLRDADDGETRLAVLDSRESLLSPPVAYGDAVLTLVDDGLLALDLKTGKPLWKYPLPTVITHGPVIRGDIAYFITDDGDTKPLSHERKPRYLYALDLAKAKRLGPPDDETVETAEK